MITVGYSKLLSHVKGFFRESSSTDFFEHTASLCDDMVCRLSKGAREIQWIRRRSVCVVEMGRTAARACSCSRNR